MHAGMCPPPLPFCQSCALQRPNFMQIMMEALANNTRKA
jgi:hypothetical protein